MLRPTLIAALAAAALFSVGDATAHDDHRHRGDRYEYDDHDYREHRHRERRRYHRRYRHDHYRGHRDYRWVREHEHFLYHGRAFRHRHGSGAWHWHRAPRYRFHARGHVCDLPYRHRHRGHWYYGTRDAHLIGALAYRLRATHRDD